MMTTTTHCKRCGKYDCQCYRVQDSTDKHGVKYFYDHNGTRVDYPTGTVFSDGYVQPQIATLSERPRKGSK